MTEQNPPIVDLPAPSDIDVQQLAEQMTDVEMKALLIQMFRFQQELIAFTRQVAATVDALGENPMLRGLTAGLRPPPPGIHIPPNLPGNGG
jgi:hypothetical protein